MRDPGSLNTLFTSGFSSHGAGRWGLSLAGVVNRSGLAVAPGHTAREEAGARRALARAGLAHLDRIEDLEAVPETVLDRMRRILNSRLDQAEEQTDSPGPDGGQLLTAYRGLRRDVIAVQTAELRRLYDGHQVSDATRRQLQRDLDLEDAGLGAD